MKLPSVLREISTKLNKQHAKAVVVGGSVRDHFLGLPTKDYDVEIFGLQKIEELEEILSEYGSVNLVGRNFGVLKFQYQNDTYDFSFPRREKKCGVGHKAFEIESDGNMSFKEAARRRDFTINAMGYDIEEKRFLDPFGAKDDIQRRRLRCVDPETFIEDPLRVYRAVQFSARFKYALTDETEVLCKEMVKEGMLDALPKERIYDEFSKLLLKSEKPSVGFELMRVLGILNYFPELEAIIDTPQDPKWHPEGDVWVHTMMVVDEMQGILADEEERREKGKEKKRLKLLFAALCHDLGKPSTTTREEDGRIRSIGHEQAGVELTRTFLNRLTSESGFIESILPFVAHHLKPSQFYADGVKEKAIRRLATKINIEELVLLAEADFLGRTTEEALAREYEAGAWLLEKAQNLNVHSAPLANLLMGRDLIALGLEPSDKFKDILESVYEAMIEGDIKEYEEAITFVKKRYL